MNARPTRVQALGATFFDTLSLFVDWSSLTHTRKLRVTGRAASAAAVVASFADYLLLDAARLGDTAPARQVAWGYYLGVVALPVYALGYWQVREALRVAAPRLALTVLLAGGFAASVGTAIHGMTALLVALSAVGSAGPWDMPGAAWGLLGPLWLLAGGAVALASVAYICAVFFTPSAYPRSAALLNPLLLVPAVAALGLLFPAWAWYLVPAAPNLAHALFFVGSSLVLVRRQPAG